MKLLSIFPVSTLAAVSVPGFWQPLPGQAVHALAVLYGVANANLIYPESTYTVEYVPIPTALAAASVSWEPHGFAMFLKVPGAGVGATRAVNQMPPTSATSAPGGGSPTAPTTTSTLWSTSMVIVTVTQQPSISTIVTAAPSVAPGVLSRVHDICSSCDVPFPDKSEFSCPCGGKTIKGNLNNYIGEAAETTTIAVRGLPRGVSLGVYCYDTPDTKGKLPNKTYLDFGM
ncbi:hypothetical protein NLG97_g7268 [Lecanicillium saksenae]|uniref:Uncharacterized protein n=1 Tax=Lecanicillium saksenae TaxID=468837 RepID=A0ACC1QMA4_9HYPO|nr:hypothetical protein NLG97_g7268 [Lecanicillium saksenae]